MHVQKRDLIFFFSLDTKKRCPQCTGRHHIIVLYISLYNITFILLSQLQHHGWGDRARAERAISKGCSILFHQFCTLHARRYLYALTCVETQFATDLFHRNQLSASIFIRTRRSRSRAPRGFRRAMNNCISREGDASPLCGWQIGGYIRMYVYIRNRAAACSLSRAIASLVT